MAELYAFLHRDHKCKKYLEDALNVFEPESSLVDIVEKSQWSKLIKSEQKRRTLASNEYLQISLGLLQIDLLNGYCLYLSSTNDLSCFKTITSLSHDLRRICIEKYEETLGYLEQIFSKMMKKGENHKTCENQTIVEFVPRKNDIAFIVFFECGLKTHALDGDDALNERDFPRLLANVKDGLNMFERARDIVKDTFMLDMMSTSLLHYLQGVAHVLISNDGFDSWRIAGSSLPFATEDVDVKDMSNLLSNLDISIPEEFETTRTRRVQKSIEIDNEDNDLFENVVRPKFSPAMTRKKRQSEIEMKVEQPSVTRCRKKYISSKKSSNCLPQTPDKFCDSKNPNCANDVDGDKQNQRKTRTSKKSNRKNTKNSATSRRRGVKDPDICIKNNASNVSTKVTSKNCTPKDGIKNEDGPYRKRIDMNDLHDEGNCIIYL